MLYLISLKVINSVLYICIITINALLWIFLNKGLDLGQLMFLLRLINYVLNRRQQYLNRGDAAGKAGNDPFDKAEF